jgi:hypothetical protein
MVLLRTSGALLLLQSWFFHRLKFYGGTRISEIEILRAIKIVVKMTTKNLV